jgi:hypothetical protein
MGERVKRLEQTILEVVKVAPAPVQEVMRVCKVVGRVNLGE